MEKRSPNNGALVEVSVAGRRSLRQPWDANALRPLLTVMVSSVMLLACGSRTALGLSAGESSDGGQGGVGPSSGGGGLGAGGQGAGGQGAGGQGGEGGMVLPPCDDPDETYIYLVTQTLGMYAFKPQSAELEYLGGLNCPVDPAAAPFSMAVSRSGIAYVVYDDGTLWKTSVETPSCEQTSFLTDQSGFHVFGMGYAVDDDARGETLYVADIDYQLATSKGLAAIDTSSFDLTPIAPFTNNPSFRIELTADGDTLYAFVLDNPSGGGTLARVDKTTGVMSDLVFVPIGGDVGSWHFAFWGGSFYFFTAPNGATQTSIRRYDPLTLELETIGTVNEAVVGAGASTCAPP